MKKKTVLILMGRYLPGFKDGGPVRTIINLVDTLNDSINFKIVTNDRDHNDSVAYPNMIPNKWNKVGNAMVYYIPPRGFSFSLIMKLANEADVVYCCGPYNDYSNKVMILKKINLIKKPVIIASMGSFSPGAYNIKGLKKRIFITLFKFFNIFSTISWSVTSKYEERDVKNIIGKSAKCYIAEDLPRRVPVTVDNKNKKSGELRIVFISRISKIKNLEYAIKIVSKLTGAVDFVIYGNKEDIAYWEKCEQLLNTLPSNISWRYEGEADSERIIDTFSKYDVFLFPTLGENYGHVIYESLAAGCVPIISDKTPWQDFNEMQCGNIISLNNFDEFVNIVQTYVDMEGNDFNQLSNNAHEYAKEKYSKMISKNGYISLFENPRD